VLGARLDERHVLDRRNIHDERRIAELGRPTRAPVDDVHLRSRSLQRLRHGAAGAAVLEDQRPAPWALTCGVRKLVHRPDLPRLQRDRIYAPHTLALITVPIGDGMGAQSQSTAIAVAMAVRLFSGHPLA
jgi:hypothetical protein